MNADRRKLIGAAIATLEELVGEIETIQEEEQSYFDDMPENLQGSARGERAEEAAGQLETAAESINEAVSSLTESTE